VAGAAAVAGPAAKDFTPGFGFCLSCFSFAWNVLKAAPGAQRREGGEEPAERRRKETRRETLALVYCVAGFDVAEQRGSTVWGPGDCHGLGLHGADPTESLR